MDIDLHKLGENLFYGIKESEWKMIHNYRCNGCLKSEIKNSSRFLCLSCRPGAISGYGYNDYCFECVQHMRNKDKIGLEIENIEDEEMKNLNNPNIEYKHYHDKHIYLNIFVNATGNYYNF